MNTKDLHPELGSGALREALDELVTELQEVGRALWITNVNRGRQINGIAQRLAALSLSSPIEPRDMTDFERKEIIRLASHPNNGETVAEYVETLLPAQASSEIREALQIAKAALKNGSTLDQRYRAYLVVDEALR